MLLFVTLETLLVNENIAQEVLPFIKDELEKRKVEIRGCEKTSKIISCIPATDEDWKTEYLDYILSIKVVENIDEAIEHINTYGSGHTDVIISENKDNIDTFLTYVDSGNVFVIVQPVSAMASDTGSGEVGIIAPIRFMQEVLSAWKVL